MMADAATSSPSATSRVEFPTRRGTLRARRRRLLRHRARRGARRRRRIRRRQVASPARPSSACIDPPGRIAGGEIRSTGERIDNLPPEAMRRVRGKRIGMIFQDPLTSLNPLYRIGDQLDRDDPHAICPLSATPRRASAPSTSSPRSASRRRSGASTAIRTSSPAACASASSSRSRSAPSPS